MAQPFRFTINDDYHGSRLDRYLTRALSWPHSLAQKAIRKGWVRVDGKRAKASQKLSRGQELRLTRSIQAEGQDSRTEVPDWAVKRAGQSIIFQDELLLVSNKPRGFVIHKGSGHPWAWLDALQQATGESWLAPVGRLDRDTSGLTVFAKTRAWARAADQALRDKALRRRYQALAYGQVPEGWVTIELATKSGEDGQQKTRAGESADSKAARSHFKITRAFSRCCLLEVDIDTGRTHQIRAHLAALGHPILGDPRYAHAGSRKLSEDYGIGGLLLHAGELDMDFEPRRHFQAPRPAAFERALTKAQARKRGSARDD